MRKSNSELETIIKNIFSVTFLFQTLAGVEATDIFRLTEDVLTLERSSAGFLLALRWRACAEKRMRHKKGENERTTTTTATTTKKHLKMSHTKTIKACALVIFHAVFKYAELAQKCIFHEKRTKTPSMSSMTKLPLLTSGYGSRVIATKCRMTRKNGFFLLFSSSFSRGLTL